MPATKNLTSPLACRDCMSLNRNISDRSELPKPWHPIDTYDQWPIEDWTQKLQHEWVLKVERFEYWARLGWIIQSVIVRLLLGFTAMLTLDNKTQVSNNAKKDTG